MRQGLIREFDPAPGVSISTLVISNQKHQQLMAAIEKDLKDIGQCEVRFGEPDWYQKFGFIYYESLYAAYKPSF